MSDFKFACPVCGQHIKCDPDEAGTELECPTCFQKVIVPQAPSRTSKFVLTASQAQTRPATPANLQTAPADPVPHSNGLSTAAAIALVLICAAAGALVAFRGMIFGPAPKQAAATNALPSATNSAMQTLQTVNSGGSNDLWTLDLTNAVLPDTRAAGRIHETDFKCDLAVLVGGTLTLRSGTSGSPYVGVRIIFYARRPEELAGKLLTVTPDDLSTPKVVLLWPEGQQQVTERIGGGFALKLQFGKVVANTISGKIYICVPDEAKSYAAGAFQAQITQLQAQPKARPNQPKRPR